VNVQFGQSVPRCEQKDEIKNCCVVRFGKEPFQTGNYTLPGSRVGIRPGVDRACQTHLKQIFEVMPCKPFHLRDITVKTTYRCLAKHRNLSEANGSKCQEVDSGRQEVWITHRSLKICTLSDPRNSRMRMMCANKSFHRPNSNSCSKSTVRILKKLNPNLNRTCENAFWNGFRAMMWTQVIGGLPLLVPVNPL
jgi:hypothetical protein